MAKTILNFHFDYWNPSLTMCTMLKFLVKLKLQTKFCTLLYLYVSGYSFASATAVTCCEKRPEPREMGTWIKEHISPLAHT